MKHFTQTLIVVIGFTVATALVAMAETQPSKNSLGNQLMKGSTPWYQKAAVTVGPATESAAKGGSLLILQAGSFLYLEGDSTLHKYQMNANALRGSAIVKSLSGGLEKALKTSQVESMTLIVPVDNLKSREKGLDENAYKALKPKENPEITFSLDSLSLAKAKEGPTVMTAKGNLTIAGTKAPIILTGDAVFTGNQVRLTGTQKLKMSDFKIVPPSISLVVTSIDCKDEIEIHYDVIFDAKK